MAGLQSPNSILLPVRTSTEFVGSAILEVVVPNASDVDLQDQFQAWDGEISEQSASIVPFVEQRPFLLLDELVTAYVVLRIHALDEQELKLYLSRLAITVEARASGQQIQKAAHAAHPPHVREATELLATESVNVSDDPLICATEIQTEDDAEPMQFIYLFWKVVIPLGRPRLRLQKLAIFLSPVASLSPPAMAVDVRPDNGDDYLQSQVPIAVNLLQSFSGDPSLDGVSPHLSASRITHAKSSVPDFKQPSRPIRSRARRLFRAAPAFLWRIRFLRFPGLSEKEAILACFDIEITQFAGCDVIFDMVSLKLSSGSWEPVSAKLPQQCRPGEQLSLIYKLLPAATFEKIVDSGTLSRTLTISLSSMVLVSPECTPKVRIKWKTALELPSANPPSTLGPIPATPVEHMGPDSLIMTGEVAEIVTGPAIANGVSMTISAPKTVESNKVFRWDILIINRSDKPQRFAIIPLTKSKTADVMGPSNRPGSSRSMDRALANAIIDGNVVYSMQKSGLLEQIDLVCLTPDVRIGSLAPSACYQAEIQFIPLAAGVLHLEALQLVDLTTQSTVDIRQLPDIVALADG